MRWGRRQRRAFVVRFAGPDALLLRADYRRVMTVLRVAPVLIVRDVVASVDFWRERVGFETDQGTREFGIRDLDDHDIAFGQVLRGV